MNEASLVRSSLKSWTRATASGVLHSRPSVSSWIAMFVWRSCGPEHKIVTVVAAPPPPILFFPYPMTSYAQTVRYLRSPNTTNFWGKEVLFLVCVQKVCGLYLFNSIGMDKKELVKKLHSCCPLEYDPEWPIRARPILYPVCGRMKTHDGFVNAASFYKEGKKVSVIVCDT